MTSRVVPAVLEGSHRLFRDPNRDPSWHLLVDGRYRVHTDRETIDDEF